MLTSDTCVNACGKLPSRRLPTGSYSSASSPTSLRSRAAARTASWRRRCARAARGCRRARTSRGGTTPSPGGQAVDRRLRAVVAGDEAVVVRSSRSIASTVPDDALVGRGEEARRAASSARSRRAASTRRPARTCCGRGRSPRRRPRVWISSRSCLHRSTGPSRPNSSTVCTARSNATQAITFECVKCWRGPAHLPDAFVGPAPAVFEEVEQARSSAHASVVAARCRHPARLVQTRRAPRRTRRAGTARSRRCRCAPARSPRSRRASRARTRSAGARRPAPYMIWSVRGSPATARSSQSRHAVASSE